METVSRIQLVGKKGRKGSVNKCKIFNAESVDIKGSCCRDPKYKKIPTVKTVEENMEAFSFLSL